MARRHLAAAGSLLLLFSLGIVAVPTAAHAAHVACGQTILVSTVLDGNVGPCATTGVTIGADNITLDLNGFTISGIPGPGEGSGADLSRRTGVTVKNGTITQFDAGVVVQRGSGNTVTGMRMLNNFGGGGVGLVVAGDGVIMLLTDNNNITNNQIRNNGLTSGIRLIGSSFNLIDGNDITDHNRTPSTSGIRIEGLQVPNGPLSTDNTVTNNRVVNSGLDGIQVLQGGHRNQVKFNQSVGNRRSGLTVIGSGDANVFEGNQARANGGIGIFIRTGPAGGIALPTNNQILRNVSFGNIFGDLRDELANCGTNQWHGNQAAIFTPPCTMNP